MTKRELKKIMQEALIMQYGFAPPQSKIKLLEASDSGQYILAEIGGYEYSWDSHTMEKRAAKVWL